MPRPELRRRITDIRTLRALAHPLRVALLNHLLAVGPQTATECAAALEASPSNCSWHLRQLAAAGVVEPDGDAGARARADRRERAWRASATGFDFGAGDPDPATRRLQATIAGLQARRQAALLEAYLARHPDAPAEWQNAAAMNAYGLLMSAAELAALVAALDAAIRPYIAATRTDAPGDARAVEVSLQAFPRPDGR
jgi:DNA-binding transcriptional ArsR family regulator